MDSVIDRPHLHKAGLAYAADPALRPLVAIQRNKHSGTGLRKVLLLELIERLKELGFEPRMFSQREKLDQWLDCPARRERLACVVAAGGDGTIGDLVNRHPDLPLALLPLGTENLLARYLEVPCCGRAVAEMIAAGHRRRLDLCQLNSRRFALMASFGFDADVVHRTHARRQGNITRFSYLQPIWESLRTYGYPELRLTLDGEPAVRLGKLAVMVNIPAYAMGLRVAASALDNDGLLDLRLFEGGSALHMLRYASCIACGTHETLCDMTMSRSSRIRIESDVPVPIQVDGDPAGWTPATVEVIPGALDVFVPQTACRTDRKGIQNSESRIQK